MLTNLQRQCRVELEGDGCFPGSPRSLHSWITYLMNFTLFVSVVVWRIFGKYWKIFLTQDLKDLFCFFSFIQATRMECKQIKGPNCFSFQRNCFICTLFKQHDFDKGLWVLVFMEGHQMFSHLAKILAILVMTFMVAPTSSHRNSARDVCRS